MTKRRKEITSPDYYLKTPNGREELYLAREKLTSNKGIFSFISRVCNRYRDEPFFDKYEFINLEEKNPEKIAYSIYKIKSGIKVEVVAEQHTRTENKPTTFSVHMLVNNEKIYFELVEKYLNFFFSDLFFANFLFQENLRRIEKSQKTKPEDSAAIKNINTFFQIKERRPLLSFLKRSEWAG